MSEVAVIKNDNIYNATIEAIKKIDPDLKGKILIKPNLTLDVSKYRRACTNPEVVRALIDIIRKKGGNPFVGDSSMVGCDTLKTYSISGLKDICEEKKVDFIDFNRCKPKKLKVDGDFIKEITIPEDLTDFDKIISVPVLKTHVLTGVSLGLKNMKGIQYRNEKIKLHKKGMKFLHQGIVDINIAFKPYLTVIDGSYGMEGAGPVGGNPIKMDLIIASKDIVTADATACKIMGINPYKIDHIKIAEEKGLGKINYKKIYGENIKKVSRKFQFPLSSIKKIKYKFFDLAMDFAALLKGTTEEKRTYKTIMDLMRTQPVITNECNKCGKCKKVCPYNAINDDIKIDYKKCKSCMICMEACLFHAIKSKDVSILKASKETTICLFRVFIKLVTRKLYVKDSYKEI